VESTAQFFTLITILVVIVASLFANAVIVRRRGQPLPLRPIRAYQVIPLTVGAAIEANRPLHLSYGGAAIGGANTLLALASSELFYHITRRAAVGDAQPILTVSDTSALPLAQDTLRRAYRLRGLLPRYRNTSARWYPSGSGSLAFAAALTGLVADERAAANVLVGSFGSELALVADASARRDQPLIAASDQLEGQAVAYAFSDHRLIGEEVFRSGAYLDDDTSAETAAALATDWLRLIVVLSLVVVTLVNNNGAFAQGFGGFLQGVGGLLQSLGGLFGGGA
jgi:hypothetical protein